MSAKFRLDELREFRTSRNSAMQVAAIRAGLSRSIPSWQFYGEESRAEEVRKAQTQAREANKSKLTEIQRKIASEIKDVKKEIEKVKYPLRASKDLQRLTLGESQRTNALLFLNTSPDPERIASEIRTAFEREDIDYAFTLQDNCLNAIRRDAVGTSSPTDAQKWLQAEVASIYNSFEGKAKIDELEGELAAVSKVDQMAREMLRHNESGHVGDFFTREEVELMPQAQVSANLQAVNESMPCWEERRVAEVMS
jgi:hypothetical protein